MLPMLKALTSMHIEDIDSLFVGTDGSFRSAPAGMNVALYVNVGCDRSHVSTRHDAYRRVSFGS
ncbi:hypothetical protein M404DRAFT_865447, partial [Pisolithus tinctorius Marx 270]